MTPGVQPSVRSDLTDAHERAWAQLGQSGACFTGRQRIELADTVAAALADPEPPPPWVGPSRSGRLQAGHVAPAAAHDVIHRIACHAGTITEGWYREMVDSVGELAWVELVAVASTVAAIQSFRRAAGLSPWQLPVGSDDPPTRAFAPEIAAAGLNWVPVAAPADVTASVVQAFTALPAEDERTWHLAAAQYMTIEEMSDPNFVRGTLTRPEIELLAMRVAQRRDCFF